MKSHAKMERAATINHVGFCREELDMSRSTLSLHRFISWMRHESDESLLQRYIGRSDETAFSILVQRYVGLIYSVCEKELHRQVDIDDACQATFLILAQRAQSIQKQDALRSWLHGVALRVSKTMRRRQERQARREREGATVAVIATPAELLADTELHETVRKEVDRLPDHYRLPLELCFWHGQSREQMAATLGWSKNQVKGQLERAKRRLKARLDQRGIQFLLPMGLGLTTIAVSSLLPAMVVAATATAATTQTMSLVMGIGNIFYRVFQATKGLGAFVIVAITMGWMPPMPFLPIFPEEKQQQEQILPDEMEDEIPLWGYEEQE